MPKTRKRADGDSRPRSRGTQHQAGQSDGDPGGNRPRGRLANSREEKLLSIAGAAPAPKSWWRRGRSRSMKRD
jgi:hypothetical protein